MLPSGLNLYICLFSLFECSHNLKLIPTHPWPNLERGSSLPVVGVPFSDSVNSKKKNTIYALAHLIILLNGFCFNIINIDKCLIVIIS
jgi:hypothetical protein